MEVVGADESRTLINPGQTVELGRSQGFNSSDKTISRRQISLSIPPHSQNQETNLQFEVLGKNPVYVCKNGEVKIFKRFERGEMESGDTFCCSAKDPIWYNLKEIESCCPSVRENDLVKNLESDIGFNGVEELNGGDVDISDLDVVKEFGFVVMGHEFDSYPKKMIKDFENWDWFLEEDRKDGDDDDDNEDTKRKGSRRRKRKKGDADDDDEEWTGESEEDEKELTNTRKKAVRPKYVTRSKDHGKAVKDTSKTRSAASDNRSRDLDDEDVEDEDNEADETLGGFIVDDENLEEEEDEEEEEEEELDDDFEEDE